VSVLRAEAFRQVDTLIDDDLIGNVGTRLEFVNTDQENGKLNRVQLLERPVDQVVNLLLEIFLPVADFGKEFIEERLVDSLVGSIVLVLGNKLGRGVAGDLLLVKRLHH